MKYLNENQEYYIDLRLNEVPLGQVENVNDKWYQWYQMVYITRKALIIADYKAAIHGLKFTKRYFNT